MKRNYVLINRNLILSFFFSLSLFSCKKNDLELNIDFGIPNNLILQKVDKLVKDGDLVREIVENDTGYFYNIDIGSTQLKGKVYFNSDRLKTGKLREYYYSLSNEPYKNLGNDTIAKNGNAVYQAKVLRADDLDKLKDYLDKKYGKGIETQEKDVQLEHKSYKYSNDNFDIYLIHGLKEEKEFEGAPVKVPFYTFAYLDFKSKTYDKDFEEERVNRRKTLKPEEIVNIYFEYPKLKEETDEFGFKKNEVIIKARTENYKTYVIEDDITECKGLLSITDAYGEVLKSGEVVYKFTPPLKSPVNVNWRPLPSTSFSFVSTNMRINELIKSKSILKVRFKPIAVVLTNGNVIR